MASDSLALLVKSLNDCHLLWPNVSFNTSKNWRTILARQGVKSWKLKTICGESGWAITGSSISSTTPPRPFWSAVSAIAAIFTAESSNV